MSFLEHKVPPPVVALLCAAAMWYVAAHTSTVELPGNIRVVAAGLISAVGVAVMLAGVVSFQRAKTTVNPLKPETATALVTSGRVLAALFGTAFTDYTSRARRWL